MEVVLREDVDKLGLRGEVVNVARGYARNYLLPRGLAEPATPGLVREMEKRDAVRARQEAKTADEARAIAQRLETTELRFDVNAGPTGSLFGSVTATNVADRLWEQLKVRVDRRKLGMDAIKRVGRYTVPVELFGDVTADVRVVVAPEGVEPPLENEPEPNPEPVIEPGAGDVDPETEIPLAPIPEGPEELDDTVEAGELEGDAPEEIPAE